MKKEIKVLAIKGLAILVIGLLMAFIFAPIILGLIIVIVGMIKILIYII